VPHFFVQLFTLTPRPVFALLNATVYVLLLLGLYRVARKEESFFDWRLLLVVDGAVFLLPPAFGQSFLWLAGSLNYLWCDALMVWVWVPFADSILRKRNIRTVWRWSLLLAGSLLLGNMSENVSATAVGVMVLWMGYAGWRDRRLPAWMPVSTLCTLAGWLVLMLAPANRANVGQAVQGMNGLFTNFQAALSMWMQHGLLLSMVFLTVFFLPLAYGKEPQNRAAFALMLFLGSLVSNFMMTAADYYPERAFTGSSLMEILAVAVLLPSLQEVVWGKALYRALACGLSLVMALQMLGALPSAYNRYRQAQARTEDVLQAKAQGTLDIVTFGIQGNSRYDAFDGLNELTDDPNYFPNVYFAKYYGLQSVVVDHFE
jgi:hypothetical protein